MKFKKALFINITKSNLGESYWQKIDKLIEKKVFLSKDSSEIRKELKATDCLLVNFGITVAKEDIDSAPNLKYIGTLSTAFGKVDTDYAKKKGISVCNLAGYSTESVAEFVIASILEHIRCLEEGILRGRAKNYSFAGISAIEIKGKVFGVIGLGAIGGRVAELAQGFGADVRYWSRNRKKDYEKKSIKYEALDKLVSEADFLSINLAQTKDTEGVFTKKILQNVKKNAVIVNTAPMDLVNIEGLVTRLNNGDITFILDHSDEMSEEDLSKLSKFKNCIIYPPIAFVSKEAAITKQDMFVGNMKAFLRGKLQNAVN